MTDTETTPSSSAEPGLATDPAGAPGLDAGTYEVLRARLAQQAAELARRAEALNAKRLEVFGAAELRLLGAERLRTEHNCVPRDIVGLGDLLVFGFNVFIGLKSETAVSDVFVLHRFSRDGDAFRFDPVANEDVPGLLHDPAFERDFAELYRYYADTRLLQLRRIDGKALAVFQTGQRTEDTRVLRWAVGVDGSARYLDNRGERDHVFPPSHDFTWTPTTRDQHVQGRHPHISIDDEVFVETVGGTLTIKVEDNTESGEGIYAEPVEEKLQSLADADVLYARVGPLILLRIRPYNETAWRHLVFNSRTKTVVRLDGIGQACQRLPEDQGIIVPGGYHLVTGATKIFDADTEDLEFTRVVRSPNGEDVLYVFHARVDGRTLLLPYNVIRKEVANPITCHGYSLFDDGTLVVFRSTSDEPTRVHPMQVWSTPFTSELHAASRPIGDSPLERIGNAELVRGISDVLSVRRMVEEMAPSVPVFEALIGACTRAFDHYHWLGEPELGDLRSPLAEVRVTAEQVLAEYENVQAVETASSAALDEAEAATTSLVRRVRGEAPRSTDDYVGQLKELRRAQGHLVTLRDLRYVDLARLDSLDVELAAELETLSSKAVDFLAGEAALAPFHAEVAELEASSTALATMREVAPIRERLEALTEGLQVLTEVVGGLSIADATVRTAILERIGEVLAGVNRTRATLDAHTRELFAAEGRAGFAADIALLGQSITGAVATADTPERCDEAMARLLLQVEDLESRYGEFDEFLGELATKREDVYEAFSSRKQALLDDRQRKAQRVVDAAQRILGSVGRRVATVGSLDEVNTFFVSDPMVAKLRSLVGELRELGDAVRAEELDGRLKAAREDAVRSLRDRLDIYTDGGESIRLGRHHFAVNTQPLDLTLVPHDGRLELAITGTDYREPVTDAAFEETKPFWDQLLVSETAAVARAEHLATAILAAAEAGEEGLSVLALHEGAVTDGALPALVRRWAETRFDEGYERGIHDHDATRLLEVVLRLREAAGPLRYPPAERAAAQLWWAFGAGEDQRAAATRRATSLARARDRFGSAASSADLVVELGSLVAGWMQSASLPLGSVDPELIGSYLVEELAVAPVGFITGASARSLLDGFHASLGGPRAKSRRDFADDLAAPELSLAQRWALVSSWLSAYQATAGPEVEVGDLTHALPEAAAIEVCGAAIVRNDSSAVLTATVDGLLSTHPRIIDRRLEVRLDELLARTHRFRRDRIPGFRRYQAARAALLEHERTRLRITEYQPKVMSAFVRNRLIDEVYLPLIGDNLAKQLGASGEGKRTDQMGLLLLISPPGYGKTTLMEYVANRLGLTFVKVNGPALGHLVTSVDPADAPNATARQEVEKISFALEMANNVLLYVDDIQHTSSELLQKFISLCDAQRRMEGVWRGRTRTYDLRGKRFAVVMAGNPYTESGERFRIPDMLANRADTWNLGDVLTGKEDLFALSYLENALTSNPVLAPLAARDRADLELLVRMARGDADARPERLTHPYGQAEVEQMVAVLRHLLRLQEVLLAVNRAYIASAGQADAFRTEPPFQLQGSYRNMNKLAEKVVAAMNSAELEALVDDHYLGEAQTLTTGAEANLLKLAELRGTMTSEQADRWSTIKAAYARVQAVGDDDDPVARAAGAVGLVADRIAAVEAAIVRAAEPAGDVGRPVDPAALTQLTRVLEAVRAAAEDAAVLANPRTQYLLGMLQGVLRETVEPLLAELGSRPEGAAPDATQLLLDDTRVRVETLRYLLEQIDGLPDVDVPDPGPLSGPTGAPGPPGQRP